MATVSLAACKIANILFGMKMWQTLLFCGVLNVVFAAESGLWGVLVIDMIQFFIKMTAVVAAAYFALKLPQVGGLHGMVEKLSGATNTAGVHYLNFLPDFSRKGWDLAVAVFIMPIAVQWWSVWYPGAEPGGGSYIAQRMLASKSEKDSLGAVLFFNVAHYVLRPWPWILVGLCSIIVYPQLSDIQAAFPNLDPKLLGHDIAYPAMLKFLPAGFVGLMVGGLLAANSSTILTHLNWGSSYLVHDFYRRFVRSDASERHYVLVGSLSTVVLFCCAAGLTFVLDSAGDAFHLIMQVGAGTGLLYLVRWFWWRVNAWCEIAAMVSSFLVSVAFLVLKKIGIVSIGGLDVASGHMQLLLTVAITTICWVLAAYLAPQTDHKTLVEFYKRVRPAGPGWNHVKRLAGITDEAGVQRDNIPLALIGWMTGCSCIWSGLFAMGSYLYGNIQQTLVLGAVFIVSGGALVAVVNQLWSSSGEPEEATASQEPAPALEEV
jgi:Na+/proline symporter